MGSSGHEIAASTAETTRVGSEREFSSGSDISATSFKRWHRHEQNEHLRSRRGSFVLCKCCYKACVLCRWFDSIDYNKKICKCCLTFKTFKNLGTIIILSVFFYILIFSVVREDALPGGTCFFVLLLVLVAYLVGYGLILIGMPPMLGHLSVGIIFGNIPRQYLPDRNDEKVEHCAEIAEKILLVCALIRAGLLLDLSRIQKNFIFIFFLSFFPLLSEFVAVMISSHFLLKLPWDWSALQGSVLCVVSLASLTSIFTNNRLNGYGNDKDISMILMAAAVMNVIFGLILYSLSISCVLATMKTAGWILLYIFVSTLLGLAVGAVAGLLISFFPDKNNTEAAALRIMMIGVGTCAVSNIFWCYNMVEEAVLSSLAICIIAANMWEELGWHKENNPVQYFYTMAYYFGQPVVLSLLGFTMNFHDTSEEAVRMSVAVLFIGLLFRESVCVLVSTTKFYPTTTKEKVFICIAWFSKGTYQALLAFTIRYILLDNHDQIGGSLERKLEYATVIRQTTVIGILLTTPFACFALTILSPVLLKKAKEQGIAARRARAYSVQS